MAISALLANTGRQILATLLRQSNDGGGRTQGTPTYLIWGSDGTRLAATNTALFGESTTEARVHAAGSAATSQDGGGVYAIWTVTGTLTATAGQTVAEVGLFDTSGHATGTLFIRGTFGALSLQAGDAVTFTIAVAFS